MRTSECVLGPYQRGVPLTGGLRSGGPGGRVGTAVRGASSSLCLSIAKDAESPAPGWSLAWAVEGRAPTPPFCSFPIPLPRARLTLSGKRVRFKEVIQRQEFGQCVWENGVWKRRRLLTGGPEKEVLTLLVEKNHWTQFFLG